MKKNNCCQLFVPLPAIVALDFQRKNYSFRQQNRRKTQLSKQ